MAVEVVTLGTGTPRTDPGKAGAATAVVVNGRQYLFDFGPGVGERLTRAAGLSAGSVVTAFLTHMHSDHTSGLADLLMTGWMFGREAALQVYGPHGMSTMCSSLADAYRFDVSKRTHSEPHTEHGHELVGTDVIPGVVFQDDLVTVEAFDVPHGDWPAENGAHPTMGYRLTAEDKTVIISGDTGPFEGMPDQYKDVDVLVHEVYTSKGLSEQSADWQTYHTLSHTSGTELGLAARKAQPGRLVLTHQLLWDAEEADISDEVAAVYGGLVTYAHDLDAFTA